MRLSWIIAAIAPVLGAIEAPSADANLILSEAYRIVQGIQ